MASCYRHFISEFAEIAQPCIYSRKKTRCFNGLQIVRRHSRSCLDLWHQHWSWAIQTSNDSSRLKRTQHWLGSGFKTRAYSCYASRTLNKAEQNYSATEKECLGVVWALQKFAMYLEGSSFKVITDHKPLAYLLSLKEPRGKLATWRVELDTFNFEIEHRLGKLMAVRDALSRAPLVGAVNISGLWSPYELMCLQQQDNSVGLLYKWVKSGYKLNNVKQRMVHRAIQKHGKNFILKDGILILRPNQAENVPRVVIPVSKAANVLEALHDRSRHFSYSKDTAESQIKLLLV